MAKLAGDVVSGSSLELLGGAGISKSYQTLFQQNYSAQVTGQKIDTIKLGAVGGSSLTSGGFKAALEVIEVRPVPELGRRPLTAQYRFTALGTHWRIAAPNSFDETVRARIDERVEKFDKAWSRSAKTRWSHGWPRNRARISPRPRHPS